MDLFLQILTLRKQLGKSEASQEMVQKQCVEAMEKVHLYSHQHQQTLHHLKQASKTTLEDPGPQSSTFLKHHWIQNQISHSI